MKITKSQLRQIIKEELIILESSNPAMLKIESVLRHTLVEYIDTYMMSMGMNPGDPSDVKRVRRKVDDVVETIIGI